jgi:nitroreductase
MCEPSVFSRRFSCRSFTPEPVDRNTVRDLLEAAILAPSGGNAQPWRFLVVRDPERRRALAAAALGQLFVAAAAAVVVVCALPELSARIYGRRGRELYCLQDTAAATENLLLAAAARGLGACWVGAFHEDRVQRVLGIPEDWRPVALVPLGHPAEAQPPRSRLSVNEVVLWLD